MISYVWFEVEYEITYPFLLGGGLLRDRSNGLERLRYGQDNLANTSTTTLATISSARAAILDGWMDLYHDPQIQFLDEFDLLRTQLRLGARVVEFLFALLIGSNLVMNEVMLLIHSVDRLGVFRRGSPRH